MKCSKARKLKSPYSDGELTEGDKRSYENHIKVCESCRTEMEDVQGLRQLFVNMEKFETPFGFHSRVVANVSTEKPGWSPRIPIPVRLAEAVMVLLLIAAGIVSGTFMVKGFMPEKVGNEMASLHLDMFQSAPPGTLGGAYLAMMEVRNEK